MKLSNLLENVRHTRIGSEDPDIAVLTADSRRAGPGAAFVAVPGADADGHDYIASAFDAGCRTFLVEDASRLPSGVQAAVLDDTRKLIGPLAARFYGHPSRKLALVGITGTNGKTSTTYLAETMLARAGRKVGVIGTINYRFAGRVVPAPTTTPGPIEFQRLLSEMADAGVDTVLAEVSSHALDQHRVDGAAFDIGLFTNLTRDHIDYHGDMARYREAKRRLFSELLARSPKPAPTAIVNADDEAGEAMVKGFAGRVLSFSVKGRPEANIRCTELSVSLDGNAASLEILGNVTAIRSPLIGRHNMANTLQAIAIGVALGLSVEAAVSGAAACINIPGRLERVPDPSGGRHVFVDYSHTPDALENVLDILRELRTGRVITVFGCGGDRDRGKRPLMGRAVGERSDIAIVTSDNPRTEDPLAILRDIEPGVRDAGLAPATKGDGAKTGEYVVIPDRREAIRLAVNLAQEGDALLIAGKGHEDYIIYGTAKQHFDDREEATRALAEHEGRRAP